MPHKRLDKIFRSLKELKLWPNLKKTSEPPKKLLKEPNRISQINRQRRKKLKKKGNNCKMTSPRSNKKLIWLRPKPRRLSRNKSKLRRPPRKLKLLRLLPKRNLSLISPLWKKNKLKTMPELLKRELLTLQSMKPLSKPKRPPSRLPRKLPMRLHLLLKLLERSKRLRPLPHTNKKWLKRELFSKLSSETSGPPVPLVSPDSDFPLIPRELQRS